MKLNDSQKIMSYINESYKENNLNEEASHKMNSIKYETNGYTKLTDGMYKGKPIVDYREEDFKKGTSVLTPMICDACGKEFYVKSNIHDFFEQGDFDDPYEVPKEAIYCPKCKDSRDVSYNGEVLIKESVDNNMKKTLSEDIYEKLVEGTKKDEIEYQEMLDILLSNLSETGKDYIETYISDGWVSKDSDGQYYMEMIDMNNSSCINDITYTLYFDINNPSDTSKWVIEKYRGNTYCSNYGDYPEMDLALFDKKISSLYRRRG